MQWEFRAELATPMWSQLLRSLDSNAINVVSSIVSQDARFLEESANGNVQSIQTYGWWPNLVNTRRAGFEDGKPRILKESIENQQS